MCVNMRTVEELWSLCVAKRLFDFAFFRWTYKYQFDRFGVNVLEQLLLSEEHEWNAKTFCIFMYLYVSGGWNIQMLRHSTRWTLFPRFPCLPQTQRICVCVCLSNEWKTTYTCMTEMISVHCYLSEKERWGIRTAALGNAQWFLL